LRSTISALNAAKRKSISRAAPSTSK
jgi:hypothetical protein